LDRLTEALDLLNGTLLGAYNNVTRTEIDHPFGISTWTFDAVGQRASMAVSGQAPVIYADDAAVADALSVMRQTRLSTEPCEDA